MTRTVEQIKAELVIVRKRIRKMRIKLKTTEWYEHGTLVLNSLIQREDILQLELLCVLRWGNGQE